MMRDKKPGVEGSAGEPDLFVVVLRGPGLPGNKSNSENWRPDAVSGATEKLSCGGGSRRMKAARIQVTSSQECF